MMMVKSIKAFICGKVIISFSSFYYQPSPHLWFMSIHLLRKVRLLVGAGAAKPGPGIGQALGPLGLNMADFCKQFNEVTKAYDKDVPIPVELSAFSNRSFTFVTKTPQTSWLIKRCAGIKVKIDISSHHIFSFCIF